MVKIFLDNSNNWLFKSICALILIFPIYIALVKAGLISDNHAGAVDDSIFYGLSILSSLLLLANALFQ